MTAPPQPAGIALNVALVSTQSQWHGGESQAALLAQGLHARGHRCTILARDDGEFAGRMQQRGFDVCTIARRGRSPWAIWKLRKVLKQLRPDVIHTNDSHALTAAGLAGYGLRAPVRVAARRVDFPLRSARRYGIFADGLLCVSTAVQQVCREAGISEHLLHLVHDGVDPRFAASGQRDRGRRSLGLSADQTLLLTVAKLTDHKGHSFLLRAMPELVSHFPQVVLGLAGDGELSNGLKSLLAQLDMVPYVRFLGYRHDVPDLLAAADVVVQPSHMEGLCSSLIDAMFAARPIVATTAGGIPDLLRQGFGDSPVAWLVPPRSPRHLATAIREVLENTPEAVARGRQARQRALGRFTADAMVEATLAAYDQIARKRYGSFGKNVPSASKHGNPTRKRGPVPI